MERKQKLYQFWLHNLPDVGDAAIRRLLAAFGDAKSVYGASEKQLSQILKKETAEKIKVFSGWWNMEKAYENMRKKKIAFLTVDDKGYPERLRRLDKPPYAIYCMGKLPGEEKPAVAVIGARECSEYGKYVAESFAGRLAEGLTGLHSRQPWSAEERLMRCWDVGWMCAIRHLTDCFMTAFWKQAVVFYLSFRPAHSR